MEEKKQLRRSSNKMIAGVCAGLAEYFNMDPTLMRVIFVILLLIGSGGFWVYIILWVLMPEAEAATPASGGGAG